MAVFIIDSTVLEREPSKIAQGFGADGISGGPSGDIGTAKPPFRKAASKIRHRVSSRCCLSEELPCISGSLAVNLLVDLRQHAD